MSHKMLIHLHVNSSRYLLNIKYRLLFFCTISDPSHNQSNISGNHSTTDSQSNGKTPKQKRPAKNPLEQALSIVSLLIGIEK
jgi:hypothetical protein